MRRLLILLTLIAYPAAADPPLIDARFRIADEAQLRGEVEGRAGPVFGGVTGGTLADPARPGEVALYLGLRPDLPQGHAELRLARPLDAAPALTVNFDRPLGRRATIATRLAVDPDAATGNSRASLEVTPATSVAAELGGALRAGGGEAASLRVEAIHRLGPGDALNISLTEASDHPPRAALALNLRF
jgi:hypothetical protein